MKVARRFGNQGAGKETDTMPKLPVRVLAPLYAAGFTTAFGAHSIAAGLGAESGGIAGGLAVGKKDGVEESPLGGLGKLFVITDVRQLPNRGAGQPPCGAVMSAAMQKDVQVQLVARECPAHQFITSPPSTMRFCPVTERAQGEAKNNTASASSAGVVTLRNGVAAAM